MTLADLQRSAVGNKIRIGQMLIEAKQISGSMQWRWLDFLDSIGIGERFAREAISFFDRRDEIQSIAARGTPLLTITAVRSALSKSGSVASTPRIEEQSRPEQVNTDTTATLTSDQRSRETTPRRPKVEVLPDCSTTTDPPVNEGLDESSGKSISFNPIPRDWPTSIDLKAGDRDKVILEIFRAQARLFDHIAACLDTGKAKSHVFAITEGAAILGESMCRLYEVLARVSPILHR